MRARLMLVAGLLPALAGLGCRAQAQAEASFPEVAATESDLVRCREDLVEVMTAYREVVRGEAAQRRVERGRTLATRLSLQDLAAYAPACPDIGRWKVAAQAARDAVVAGRSVTAATPASTGAPLASFPAASYSQLCGQTRSSTEAFFAAQVAFQVAQGVWSAASRACEEVVVILGEGGNASLACIVADEALYVAEKVLEDIAFCDGDIDSAEIEGSYERLGYMQDEIVMLDGKIDVIDRRLVLIDQKIDALTRAVEQLRLLHCESIRLEHTPEGRRASEAPACADQPGFPYNWPFR
jgi:hypothetical protein